MRFGSCCLLTVALAAFVFGGCDSDSSESVSIDPAEQLPGGATTNTLLLGPNAYAAHVPNITFEHEGDFFTGNSFFNKPWVESPSSTTTRDGLGPLFNARSCSACHFKDGRGAPPTAEDPIALGLLFRLSGGAPAPHGQIVPDPVYGGQLHPFGISGVPPEAKFEITYNEVHETFDDGTPYTLLDPTYAFFDLAYGPFSDNLQVSPRVAPAVIGMGLLEAIEVERLEELADPDDADGDGISGEVSRVYDPDSGGTDVGRFGWKAEQPTVRSQTTGAFLGDIGITTDDRPGQTCTESQAQCLEATSGGEPEIEEHLLNKVVVYASMLAVPIRTVWDTPEVLRGKAHFGVIGCASCHVPSHQTGEHDTLPELSNHRIWPYTDLLLHDLGPGLADGRPVNSASGSEWRTPPLWGLSHLEDVSGHQRLLHDGRARGVVEAILWHGGEAESARDAFRALSAEGRSDLVRFVESL